MKVKIEWILLVDEVTISQIKTHDIQKALIATKRTIQCWIVKNSGTRGAIELSLKYRTESPRKARMIRERIIAS